MPGNIPAINKAPIETPPTTPYTTITILGGISIPNAPPDAATADEKPFPYPLSIIAGIITEPIAATVAGPDPEIAAKKAQAAIVTVANPPI